MPKSKRKQIIKSMIIGLNSVGISFLDVAKYVVRKKYKHDDKYIVDIVFDYKAFKKVGLINIICNSRDAEECLYKNKNTNPKINCLSRRHNS